MERRTSKRIEFNTGVTFPDARNVRRIGTVSNLSEKGMFISVKRVAHLNPQFEACITWKDKSLVVPVKLNRIMEPPHPEEGIGVEIVGPPQEYLEFVNKIRSSHGV